MHPVRNAPGRLRTGSALPTEQTRDPPPLFELFAEQGGHVRHGLAISIS